MYALTAQCPAGVVRRMPASVYQVAGQGLLAAQTGAVLCVVQQAVFVACWILSGVLVGATSSVSFAFEHSGRWFVPVFCDTVVIA